MSEVERLAHALMHETLHGAPPVATTMKLAQWVVELCGHVAELEREQQVLAKALGYAVDDAKHARAELAAEREAMGRLKALAIEGWDSARLLAIACNAHATEAAADDKLGLVESFFAGLPPPPPPDGTDAEGG